MIYKLKPVKDLSVKRIYNESMKDLEKFYGFKWTYNRPKIFIVDSRKMIDSLRDEKTESWVVGWAEDSTVFLLDIKNVD